MNFFSSKWIRSLPLTVGGSGPPRKLWACCLQWGQEEEGTEGRPAGEGCVRRLGYLVGRPGAADTSSRETTGHKLFWASYL